MRNKRGQFFLVVAVIIIGLVVGLTTAVNSAKVGDSQEAFYDLADEVGFETKRVLDFGVVQGEPDIEGLMTGFLNDYKNYIAQEEVLFIFGNNAGELKAFVFKKENGVVGISTGEGLPATDIEIQYITNDVANVDVNDATGEITVEIAGVEHVFNKRDGQDFFFVIGKEENGEKFVAKGE